MPRFCCAASAATNNSALFSFVEEEDDEAAATLRAELKGLPLSALQKHALESGADARVAEQALEAGVAVVRDADRLRLA